MYVLPRLRAARRLCSVSSFAALALAAGACTRVEVPRETSAGQPERIVAASATAVDFAVAVAGLERMAGVPSQALEYSVLHAGRPEPRAIARLDAYLAEPVLALRPDLVVIDPWQSPETSAQLRSAGVRVFALPLVRDFADARAALAAAGESFGDAEATARALVEFDRRLLGVRERRVERGWHGLAYSNFGGAGSTAGRETTIDALFELVGVRNLVAERGTVGHAGITFEDLLALDPDVIVVSEPLRMGEGPSGDRGGAAERLLRSESSLAGLRAVRENRIVALPAWLFATGSHELVSAAEELQRRMEQLAQRLAERTGQ